MARLWWIVLLTVVAAVLLATVRDHGQATKYRANALVYLGQPISASGAVLPTISSEAATGIDIAKSDAAISAAAEAAGVKPTRIRNDLVVTAVTSPLASKLQSAPAQLKVTVTDRDPDVADAATLAIAEFLEKETNGYATDKVSNLSARLKTLQAQEKNLVAQRTTALKAIRSAAPPERSILTLLVGTINAGLTDVQADIADTDAILGTARAIELSKMVTTPHASKVTSNAGTGGVVIAGFFGLVIGLVIALVVSRLRSSSTAP
jgi:hypothetical protein